MRNHRRQMCDSGSRLAGGPPLRRRRVVVSGRWTRYEWRLPRGGAVLGEFTMDVFGALRCGLRVAATMLPLGLAGGCYQPLALQDAYFAPGGAAAAAHSEAALHTVRSVRTWQVARQSCSAGGATGADPAAASARAALARLCSGAAGISTAAEGGLRNAYRRWATGTAYKLPELSVAEIVSTGGS